MMATVSVMPSSMASAPVVSETTGSGSSFSTSITAGGPIAIPPAGVCGDDSLNASLTRKSPMLDMLRHAVRRSSAGPCS